MTVYVLTSYADDYEVLGIFDTMEKAKHYAERVHYNWEEECNPVIGKWKDDYRQITKHAFQASSCCLDDKYGEWGYIIFGGEVQ